ncbi:hypothetical protein AMECASPLE_006058 [Ameca splendens]|uniref:Uncharacterized protein n=1 Tax=Ameca splendens TaxID=208324 RepID=A0ABV0ZJ17_9TELE
MGRRRGTPWTGHLSITGQHRKPQDKQPCTHSFTPKGNLERPVNLTVMFLDCGRKLEYPLCGGYANVSLSGGRAVTVRVGGGERAQLRDPGKHQCPLTCGN